MTIAAPCRALSRVTTRPIPLPTGPARVHHIFFFFSILLRAKKKKKKRDRSITSSRESLSQKKVFSLVVFQSASSTSSSAKPFRTLSRVWSGVCVCAQQRAARLRGRRGVHKDTIILRSIVIILIVIVRYHYTVQHVR